MDIMIDIETLGLSADAKILQIGVAAHLGYTRFTQDFKFDVTRQPNRTESPSTLAWWAKQDPKVRDSVFDGLCSLRGGLQNFLDCLYDLTEHRGVPADEVEYWCRGMEFDFLILEHALNSENLICPWKFWQKNDLRTLSKLVPQIPAPKNEAHHNAAFDALHQLDHLHALKRFINEPVLFVPGNSALLPKKV